MHVLVTGGTGFIGKALCAELHRRGHEISALARNTVQATVWLPPGTRVVTDLSLLHEEVPDAIINLAGENLAARRWDAARKRALLDSRVDVTRSLIEFMRHSVAKPRALISGSAVGWYGARGNEELTEDSAGGREDEFQVQLCRAWEEEAQKAEDLGVRVCRVRTGLVLERDGGPLAKLLLPMGLGIVGAMGDGRQWMSWVHRADLVSLLIKLCENESAAGVYNGTAPHPVTNREFVATLSQTLGRPAILPMPAFALRLAVGEMAELLLSGQRVLPQRTLASPFGFRYPDLASALRHVLRPQSAT